MIEMSWKRSTWNEMCNDSQSNHLDSLIFAYFTCMSVGYKQESPRGSSERSSRTMERRRLEMREGKK